MTPERWQQIDHLFHAALAHEPAQRAGFLNSACNGDEPLRRELESLISSHEGAQNFIEAPAGDVAAEMLGKPQAQFEPKEQIENYKIVRHLGSGGMGEVYLADDTRLNRRIALKLLPPHFTGDHGRVRRFDQEARAASALNHPNIVTVYEIGQSNSTHFFATEFVDGVTIREHLANVEMPLGQVLDVAAQVASALTVAHDAGIVHRDIKPENVMLRRDGFVKVLDFGLAKLSSLSVAPTNSQTPTKTLKTDPGTVMGTVQYMSPEQSRGEDVDHRTDIWSLGVVVYEMLTGRAPFEGETPSHVIVSILENKPLPLNGDPHVSGELERIVGKALSKEKEKRYQTAGDMALDLKNLKEELTAEARRNKFRGTEDREGKTRTTGRSLNNAVTTPATLGLPGSHSSAEHFSTGVARHRGILVLGSVTAVVLVASLFYFSSSTRSGDEAIDSVAVLPFVNAGGKPENDYLAEGILDSVIKSLSRLPDLRVISLGTVSRYEGQQIDPQVVGRELNVRAVLVGRMTQRGDALAISAELVDVRYNRRLWGGQYNGKPSDILAVQEEIAGQIAEKLRSGLDSSEKQRLTKNYTESADAYDAYNRGRFMLEKRTAAATHKSIEYLEQAVKLDSNYALAYATLSYAYWSLGTLGISMPKAEYLPKAKAAAAKALEIDDALAEAHTALGRIRQIDWDWTGAERAFKRGIELNPNSGFAHNHYSFYLRARGRVDEAVAESKRAVELEPTSVLYNRDVAIMLYYARRYDEGIEQSLKTLELDPNMPTAYRWLAKSYEQKKLYDQAVEAYLKTAEFGPEVEAAFKEAYATSGWKGFWRKSLDLKKERAKKRNISLLALAETYLRLGEKDQAFFWLEKVFEEDTPDLMDPIWDDLRSDPRYADMIRRTGLEP